MRLTGLPKKTLNCNQRTLDLSSPKIMGILNVTPDSFSDGGQYNHKDKAIAHALAMIEDGADIIDIGGESTRPGASLVEVQEEIERILPVVEALAKEDIIISIDTSQPEVIEAAVACGAHIWNDVRALTRPNALQTAAKLHIPVILMHMRGEPTTMNQLNQYDNIVSDLCDELMQRIDDALSVGIKTENIIIDPGFGFAKNAEQNIELLKNLWQLDSLGYPILSALSRKRFIGEILNEPDAQKRAIGSVTAHLLSIQQGASIVRVHDVKAMSDAIKVWNAVNA